MYILCIRTDQAICHLALVNGAQIIGEIKYEAQRELSATIHLKVKQLMDDHSIKYTDITGVNVFKGPGSFTGLRIGISVANALAHSLPVPIVGSTRDDWLMAGCQRIDNGENDKIIFPEYGSEPHTTVAKK